MGLMHLLNGIKDTMMLKFRFLLIKAITLLFSFIFYKTMQDLEKLRKRQERKI